MATYFHNLTPDAEEMLTDYDDVQSIGSVDGVPLVDFTNLKTGLFLEQFIQLRLPDKEFNEHIFLALKNMEGTIIQESLWTLKKAREIMDKY